MDVDIAGEGPLDLAILRRLIAEAGLAVGRSFWGSAGRGGKSGIDTNLGRWAAGAIHGRSMVVLRDFDGDEPCPGALRARLLATVPPAMVFRIAVHAAEAWLIADRAALAQALAVSENRLAPGVAPDGIVDPKRTIMEAARRSRRGDIRNGVPPSGVGSRQGGDYNPVLIGFVRNAWRPDIAATRSPSLHRAIQRIADLRAYLEGHG